GLSLLAKEAAALFGSATSLAASARQPRHARVSPGAPVRRPELAGAALARCSVCIRGPASRKSGLPDRPPCLSPAVQVPDPLSRDSRRMHLLKQRRILAAP